MNEESLILVYTDKMDRVHAMKLPEGFAKVFAIWPESLAKQVKSELLSSVDLSGLE